MCGVIDENGQQWERCNVCAEFVRIQDLCYEEPTAEYKHGRDVCSKCATRLKTVPQQFTIIRIPHR